MERTEREKKCIYCEDNKEATHFICVDCECGMCDDCYDSDCEHTEHYFDFHESVEDEEFYDYIVEKTGMTYGYMCYFCMAQRQKEFDKTKENKGGKNE